MEILERQIITTEDGSDSVFDLKLNEHYHSVHGALQESRHIFIGAGLHAAAAISNELNILEVGFGTGLNALLTLADPSIAKHTVHYVALEPFPLAEEMVARLNYCSTLEYSFYKEHFLRMHTIPPGIPYYLSDHFVFNRLEAKIEVVQLAGSMFHLVYFDAFSPQVQPELWTPEIFFTIYCCMRPGGILVTYSCNGSVKRALKTAGFRVEGLPGPPGKREITRAIKE
jgi:tRNA U34 5-methylaminomethyl-2-thiouridine-forming methyltransferase MnmC